MTPPDLPATEPATKPRRFSRTLLNQLLIPGNTWHRIPPHHIPHTSRHTNIQALHRAAKRRGGTCSIRITPNGEWHIYATGCTPLPPPPPPPGTVARRRAHLR